MTRRAAVPPLPSWYPDNPPQGVTPLPPAVVVPLYASDIMQESLPKALYDAVWLPTEGIEMTECVSTVFEDDAPGSALEAVHEAEKAIASRFVALLQGSRVWNQLRAEIERALTRAMTPNT